MVLSGTDPLHVAIDGPAGSGKSSVARAVAEALGLAHVDTGAMYRVLTWVAVREGIDLQDGDALANRLRALDLSFQESTLFVDGQPVGDEIRTPGIDERVSGVSALPPVRAAMQIIQRAFGWRGGGVVMEGRDIGSVVLPMARCKIYLTASVEERARRRAKQAGRGGSPDVLAEVAEELRERDQLDSTRRHSPLRISPDAHVVDNTAIDAERTVQAILELARTGRPKPDPQADHYWMGHYRFLHGKARWLFRAMMNIEVHGWEHQSEISGGAVYACNHIFGWDPPILGGMVDRQIAFLAKAELFRWPLGPMIRWVGAVPIVRGRYDARAFEVTRDHLRSGRNVAIFPEGTRKPVGRPGPVKRGLGILVESVGAPWVPCFVRGTASMRTARNPETPMELWIGPPSYPIGVDALRASGLDSSAIQSRIGDLYLAQIRALSQRAQEYRPLPDYEA
jgi:cytidylate kinase